MSYYTIGNIRSQPVAVLSTTGTNYNVGWTGSFYAQIICKVKLEVILLLVFVIVSLKFLEKQQELKGAHLMKFQTLICFVTIFFGKCFVIFRPY